MQKPHEQSLRFASGGAWIQPSAPTVAHGLNQKRWLASVPDSGPGSPSKCLPVGRAGLQAMAVSAQVRQKPTPHGLITPGGIDKCPSGEEHTVASRCSGCLSGQSCPQASPGSSAHNGESACLSGTLGDCCASWS